MKKNVFKLIFAVASLTGILAFGLMSFKGINSDKPTKPSPLQSHCDGAPPGYYDPGAPFTSFSTDFVTRNFSINIGPGSTANIAYSGLCYVHSVTPPWTSNQYVGVITPLYRPSGTRVFAGTWPGNPSVTYQFTLYSTGALYIQQTAGPALSKGIAFVSSSYSL